MDRFTQEQDLVAAILSKIRQEQERSSICYSLMYDNPGKYTRLYKQPIPFGFETEIKNLKKERDLHDKRAKKLWGLLAQDKYGAPYYLTNSPFSCNHASAPVRARWGDCPERALRRNEGNGNCIRKSCASMDQSIS